MVVDTRSKETTLELRQNQGYGPHELQWLDRQRGKHNQIHKKSGLRRQGGSEEVDNISGGFSVVLQEVHFGGHRASEGVDEEIIEEDEEEDFPDCRGLGVRLRGEGFFPGEDHHEGRDQGEEDRGDEGGYKPLEERGEPRVEISDGLQPGQSLGFGEGVEVGQGGDEGDRDDVAEDDEEDGAGHEEGADPTGHGGLAEVVPEDVVPGGGGGDFHEADVLLHLFVCFG